MTKKIDKCFKTYIYITIEMVLIFINSYLCCLFKMVWPAFQFMGKLFEEIISMTPPNREEFAEYRLLLTGPVGSGKSSFINTVYSVFSDRIRQPALTGTSTAGVTKQVNYTRFDNEVISRQSDLLDVPVPHKLLFYSSLHHKRVSAASCQSDNLAVNQYDKRT